MVICTFFGHRECPAEVAENLESCLTDLLRHQGATLFLVGNNGQFDVYCQRVLRQLKNLHPEIQYSIVLSALPTTADHRENWENTILPEGIETVPPRFAIEHRNRWLLRRADVVVCYVKHPFGGAHKFVQLAKKQGKIVINLAEP